MNKSFKVVFNKARGALMVVNEVTSSVQAKGTKTVIATAVASLVAGGAMAADVTDTAMNVEIKADATATLVAAPLVVVNAEKTTVTATKIKEGNAAFAIVKNAEGKTTLSNGHMTGFSTGAKADKGQLETGLVNVTGGDLTIEKMTFADNELLMSRGVVRVEAGKVGIKDSAFTNNKNAFGALNVQGTGAVAVENTKFVNNTSRYHGGAVVVNNKDANVTLTNVAFEQNTAEKLGGAIETFGKVKLENVTFTGNTSKLPKAGSTNQHAGGALYVGASGVVTGKNVTFAQNKALTANGGAVAVVGGTMDLTGGAFDGNEALAGGAMAIYGGKVTVTDVDFVNNKTTGWGGAVRVDNAGALTVKAAKRDVTIAGNTSGAADSYTGKLYNGYTGGFLHLTTTEAATFDVAEGKTITVGKAGVADKNVDSITSGAAATLTKTGAGALVVNGNTEAFEGTVNVKEGSLTLATGFGSYSIANQGNVNSNKELASVDSSLVVAKNASANVVGDWAINADMTINNAGTVELGNVVVDELAYTTTNEASETKKSAKGTLTITGEGALSAKSLTVGHKAATPAAPEDVATPVTISSKNVTIGDLTVYGENGVKVEMAGKLEVTGKIDSVKKGVSVAGEIETNSANLVKTEGDELVNNGTVVLAENSTVSLNDAGTFSKKTHEAMKMALFGKTNGKLHYVEADFVADDGKGKGTLADLITVGGQANDSAVKVVYNTKDAVANGGDADKAIAVTVGSVEFVKAADAAADLKLESVKVAGVEGKLFTLRGDKNGDVILGAGDLVVDAQHVRFGEEAADKGVINNELKATQVSVKGQFNANKGVTIVDTVTVEEDGAFTTAWAEGGKFVMNGGALGILGTKPVKAETKAAADAEPVPFSGAVVFNTKVENKQVGSNLSFNNTAGNVVGLGADALTAKAVVAEHYGEDAAQKNVYYVAKQVKTDAIGTLDMLVDVAGVAATEGFTAKDGVLSGALIGANQGTPKVKLLNLTAVALEGKAGEKTLKLAKSAVEGTTVDYGTVFYSAPSATNANIWTAETTGAVATDGKVAFKANEQLVENVLDHGVMTGAVVNALNNVTFGQNQLVDAVVFGTDAYFDAAAEQWTKIEEAMKKANPEVKPEEVQLAKDAFYAQTEDAYVEGVDAVSYLGVLGGAFSTAVDINNETAKVLNRRMSVANGVERAAQGVNVWADVVATRNEGKGLFGDNVGYEADIYGAAFGADFTASCGAILGAALTVGQADANSAGLDYTKVENDVEYFGFSIYGAHQMGLVNGMFDIGYTSLKNELSTNTVLGKFKEDVDGTMFTVGLGAEYLAKAGSVNVVPHAGLRWTRVDLDDSKFGADYDTMNLFQMPIGVTFSGNFETAGWKLAPMFDLSVVPTFGDKDATADYGFGYSDAIRVVDSNPVQATLGVSAQTGAWTFGVNYGLTAGSDDRMNNSLNASARYTF